MEYWDKLFNEAKQFVLDAGEQIRQSFHNTLTIEFKENASDLVTNMDKQIEQFFIENVHKHYPTHRVLGEEGYGDDITSIDGTVWIIDPIDGTMNFVHMQRHFGISLGIYHNGEGKIGMIYDVVSDELYYAIKGKGAYLNNQKLPELRSVQIDKAVLGINSAWAIENNRIDNTIISKLFTDVRGTRSLGSATIEMAYVASGRIDGYMSLRLSPWDFAAGKILIEEVGGIVTNINGESLGMLSKQIPVLAAKPGLHTYIVDHYFKNLERDE